MRRLWGALAGTVLSLTALTAHAETTPVQGGKATLVRTVERARKQLIVRGLRAREVSFAVAGVNREVKEYAEPRSRKSNRDREKWGLDYFFETGKLPSKERAFRNREVDQVDDDPGIMHGFYKKGFGRDSLDDKAGMKLSVMRGRQENGDPKVMREALYGEQDDFVRHGGQEKDYGQTELDSTGHELTHGVMQWTAQLAYEGQSGALNESFSDVLGIAIRQWKLGITVTQADWRLFSEGGRLTTAKDIGPLRSMSNPGAYGQPSHMKDFRHTERDNGGVHANSGIANRAFYGAAMRIGGFVWEKSAKIWYISLRDYLREDASFQDAAQTTSYVAAKLYGDGSREHRAVISGWADVGIRVDSSAPAPTLRDASR